MRGIAVTLFAALALSASYAAGALDLKGIELGQHASVEELNKQLGVFSCEEDRHRNYCEGGTQIEGVRADVAVTFDSAAHAVQSISAQFDPLDFDQLLVAAIAKWGKPTSRSQTKVSNAFGVAVMDVIVEWAQPDGHMVTLAKYLDLTHGVLCLDTPAPKNNPADSRM